MKKVESITITKDPKQALEIQVTEGMFTLELEYSPRTYAWYFSIKHRGFELRNRKLFVSPNMLRQWRRVLPFGMACYSTDNQEPFFVDDFSSGRCGLLVLEGVNE